MPAPRPEVAPAEADPAPGGPAYRVLEAATVAAILALTSFGLVALVAAIVGRARPAVVFPVAVVAWLVLLAVWRPDRTSTPRRPVPTWVVVAGLAVIALSGFTNALDRGEYVQTNRDPGIYTAGGLWIAANGNLVVDGRGPGLDGAPGLSTTALGQQSTKDPNRLEIQGAHLFPSLLAQGKWLGGYTGFGVVPAVIGMVALAAVFLVGLRLVPGWVALAATTALAANFAFVYGVRGVLSEPVTLAFFFGGLWMLMVGLRDRSGPRLVLSGAVLATALCARLDAGVALLLLPAAVAALSLRPGPDGRRTPWRTTGLFVVAWIPPAAIGWIDLHERNDFYATALASQTKQLQYGLIAGLVLAAGVLAVGSLHAARPARLDRWIEPLRARRSLLAVLAAGLFILVVLSVWFVRPNLGAARSTRVPALQDSMAKIQTGEGFAGDGNRTYAEASVDRLGWYLGDLVLAAGVAGLAVVAFRLVTDDDRPDELLLVALIVPTTVLYVWKPAIFNDQPWMIRRYLPVTLPGLLLAAAVAVDAVSGLVERLRPTEGPGRLAPVAWAGVAGAVLVLSPLQVTLPLRSARWQAGGFQGISALCHRVGPQGVAVFSVDGLVGATLLPSFRGACDVPAASMSNALYASKAPLPLDRILPGVERADRELYVVADHASTVTRMAPTAVDIAPVVIFDSMTVKPTINLPPSQYRPERLVVWVGRVPTP